MQNPIHFSSHFAKSKVNKIGKREKLQKVQKYFLIPLHNSCFSFIIHTYLFYIVSQSQIEVNTKYEPCTKEQTIQKFNFHYNYHIMHSSSYYSISLTVNQSYMHHYHAMLTKIEWVNWNCTKDKSLILFHWSNHVHTLAWHLKFTQGSHMNYVDFHTRKPHNLF